MSSNSVCTVGRRKTSVARLRLSVGSGVYTVNGQCISEYFGTGIGSLKSKKVLEPFVASDKEGQFSFSCTVSGGGRTGQAEAMRHAVARALEKYDVSLRGIMRKNGFLTRDSREVERKKYGFHKARKRTQFSKR
ncbi:30S ribosomal protein S9 [Candidatus Sneabacter namystus]|uniref:Small ribosomal subunit protein uS9 n=1 Tax=Candidatus Sneabacter namystus TaxID=2601646 RepID=A0A5C0UIA7_9RICK|nr:30S ribosomal protein S9 [Candidatus Sneabacter namystus]QEK39470.1 30S ribosomal protein S9 [Candidatus Sneabacter namystus]